MQILLIEDDKRLADLIKSGLEKKGFTVATAADGDDGLKMGLDNRFNLIISDIMLPGKSGLEVSRLIRKSRPGIPILMLTALGTTDDKVEGFDAGADDYLVKPFEFRELHARVRALMKRAERLADDKDSGNHRLEYDEITMDLNAKAVNRNSVELNLTPREFNLLEFLMRNPEKVLSRDQIAREVWDTHFDTGTNFIDVYINYLRKKIDKPFDHRLIHTKTGMGFVLKRKKKKKN